MSLMDCCLIKLIEGPVRKKLKYVDTVRFKFRFTQNTFWNITLEMATAQRTRPRAVVGAPRRAAWQLKSALRHSISAAPRTKIFLHFFYNYCW